MFRSRLKLPLHPLAASHYFNQYFARFDTMHVNDLRGTIAIAGGSLLVHLVTRIRALGNTQQQRMDDINKSMREFQKGRTEHRMPNLRLTDLRTDKGWSMLCGKLVKAANTRAMLPFLSGLAQTHCTGRDGFDSSCNKVFTSLMTIQRIMYSSGTFLTDEAKEEFKDAHLRLGRHWQLLRQLCERAGVNSFQITPKLHYTQHFADQANLINPRVVQNYIQESLIGRVAKVWSACANGPYADTVQQSSLARQWVGLELRICEDDDVSP